MEVNYIPTNQLHWGALTIVCVCVCHSGITLPMSMLFYPHSADYVYVTMQIESVFLIIHVHTLDQEILKRSYNDSKEEYINPTSSYMYLKK